eukprot:2336268-Rhodomonas_salina.1
MGMRREVAWRNRKRKKQGGRSMRTRYEYRTWGIGRLGVVELLRAYRPTLCEESYAMLVPDLA